MADVGSGLGERLLRDSLLRMVQTALADLGWFAEGVSHAPVQMVGSPLDWDVLVRPNLVGFHVDGTTAREVELGNDGMIISEDDAAIVVYAESESLGVHLSADIIDVLRGNHPSIGRVRAAFDIVDLQQATPPVVGYAVISNIDLNRVPTSTKVAWKAHWYEITFTVIRYFQYEG